MLGSPVVFVDLQIQLEVPATAAQSSSMLRSLGPQESLLDVIGTAPRRTLPCHCSAIDLPFILWIFYDFLPDLESNGLKKSVEKGQQIMDRYNDNGLIMLHLLP